MISPINFNYSVGFTGTKKDIKAIKDEPKKTDNHIPQKITAGACAALMAMTMAGCSKQADKSVDASTTSWQEGVSQIQHDEEVSKAREEYYSRIAEEEGTPKTDAEMAKQIEEGIIQSRGVDAYIPIDLKYDEDKYSTYLNVKKVLQQIGGEETNKIIRASYKNYVDPKKALALAVDLGGVPELSSMASEDVVNKYGETSDKATDFVRYFAICLDRADCDLDKAVKLFTGKSTDISKSAKVIEILGDDATVAIADNDAVTLFQLSE